MPSPILHSERPQRPCFFQSRAEEPTIKFTLGKLSHREIIVRKSFRIRSYEKCACNSFRIHSYKNIGLKMPCFHTLTKNIGGRGSLQLQIWPRVLSNLPLHAGLTSAGCLLNTVA